MAKTARDVMSPDCECVGERETVLDAAKRLADLGVGSMPICGEDDRLKGMITDRGILDAPFGASLAPPKSPRRSPLRRTPTSPPSRAGCRWI